MDTAILSLVAKVSKTQYDNDHNLVKIDEEGVQLMRGGFLKTFKEYEENDHYLWAYENGIKFYAVKSAWGYDL